MRLSSVQKVQYYSIAVFLSFALLVLTMILLQTSITCMDHNGCLFEHCAKVKFNPTYRTLIAKAHNDNCKY